MNWNYRVCKRKVEDEWMYDIREVYHHDDGTVEAWTAEPCAPHGLDDRDWLKADFYMMEQAFMRPVLDITDEDNPTEEGGRE